jgi:TolB-like protein/Flp pilus assembly protein TadD
MLALAAALAAILVVVVGLNVGGLRRRLFGRIGTPRIESLAVLPLANLSGDPAQEYFADGMTEELITDLAPIPALKVISRTSVMRFKGSTLPLRDIARALDVDAVVEGSVLRAGDRVRITAQLVEASSDHHLWARSFERDFIDVLTLQSEVAREIAREIQIQVTPQMATRLARHGAVHPEAYDGYLKGRFEVSQVTDQGLRRGIAHFERAVELDPSDARYSAALADAYLVLVQLIGTMPQREGMEKVKTYARRALAADGNSAEAHTSMAAGLYFGDWNWPEAERHVRRALELNPGYTTAHLIHAVMLTTAGRIAEATAENARALELDPLSLICHWNAGTGLYAARRYDESLALARRAAELFPGSPLVHNALLGISEQLGDYPAALDLIERGLLEEDGGKAVAAELRRRYQAEGPPGYWRGLRHYFDAWPPERRRPLERLAAIHAHLGEVARAMDCLERAFAEHSGDMLFLGVDPAYDPLRSDPRFQALVRRVGIPQSAAGVAPRSRPRGRRSGARAARPRPADPAAERPDAPTRRG